MKKKLAAILVLVMVLSLCMVGCGGNDSGGDTQSGDDGASNVKIVWGNYGSSSMPLYFGDQDTIAYAEEKSNGSLSFEYSADGVLGGEADMMQQVMDGTIQAATITTSTFGTYTELMDVFQLPFLIGDYDTEREVLTSDQAKAIFQKVGDDLGVKIIPTSVGENGMRHFANNVRPIEKVADLKGLKIRIVPSNMLTEVMTNLGANPQVIAYADVYSALQNKVVDGEEINITSIYAMKHYEQIKYVSEIGMYPFPGIVIYNLDFWNSLSEEQQNILLDAYQIGSDNIFEKYLPDYEKEAYAAMEEKGVEINTISEENRDEFKEIAQKTWDSYREKDPLMADLIEYAGALE